jgi:hypothetical protein
VLVQNRGSMQLRDPNSLVLPLCSTIGARSRTATHPLEDIGADFRVGRPINRCTLLPCSLKNECLACRCPVDNLEVKFFGKVAKLWRARVRG